MLSEKRLLFITYCAEKRSGWGRLTYEIVTRLKGFGFLPIVLSDIGQGLASLPYERAVFAHKPNLFQLFVNMWRARQIANLEKVSVVHCLDAYPYLLYGYASVVGTGRILTMCGVGTYTILPFYSRIWRSVFRIMFRRLRAIYSISDYTHRAILSVCPSAPTSVVHMGLSKFALTEDEFEKARDRYASYFDLRMKTIITVGAIKPRKGQLDTLKAVHELLRRGHAVQYLIVGRPDFDSYYGEMAQYIALNNLGERVRIITDANSDADLAYLYTMSDVFTLNSITEGNNFEGFGLVFLEAGQYGVPGVGSRGCGIEDAIWEGHTGYLANQQDFHDIADKIELVLSRPKESYSDAFREFVARFDWDVTVKEYTSQWV